MATDDPDPAEGPDDAVGLDGLEAWAADLRADDAAGSRARRRWLRRSAEEDSLLAGVLADLFEARRPVSVTTLGQRSYTGEVAELGHDWFTVRARGRATVVALEAVTSVVAEGAPASGERREPGGRRLADRLAEAAADQPDLQVVCRDGRALRGRLRSVGGDVLALTLEGRPSALAYVPLWSISEVALLTSG